MLLHESNIALVKNNAVVGAEIAMAVSNISSNSNHVSKNTIQSIELPRQGVTNSRVVCVGGAVIDTVAKPIGSRMLIGTSNPGKIHQSDGGVGRNIAETLGRLGSAPVLYTAVGADEKGRGLLQRLEEECRVKTTPTSINVVNDICTAEYYALNDQSSSLVGAIAAMDVLSRIPIPSIEDLDSVEFLVLDANLPAELLLESAKRGVKAGCKVCFEPTSVPKAQALMQSDLLQYITYAFPNEDELFAMAAVLGNDCTGTEADEKAIQAAASILLSKMRSHAQMIITRGERGVMLAVNSEHALAPVIETYPADVVSGVTSSNGPGDTLVGAFIHAVLNGKNIGDAIGFGMSAAVLSLRHETSAISPHLASLSLNNKNA